MKILIVGASGAVGRLVARKFQNLKDLEVYGTYYSSLPRASENAKSFKLDVTSEEQVAAALLYGDYDFVIWLAGSKNIKCLESTPELATKLNVEPLQNYVQSVNLYSLKAKLIYISTDYVFNGTDGRYYDDASVAPTTQYGKSKVSAEILLKKSGVAYTCIRTSAIMTPGAGFYQWLSSAIRHQTRVEAYENIFFSPTSPDSFARAMLAIMRNFCDGDVLHFAGNRISRFQFSQAVCRGMGFNIDKVVGVTSDLSDSHFCEDLSLVTSEKLSHLVVDMDALIDEVLQYDHIH